MEKRNYILEGVSPCDADSRPATHVVDKKAVLGSVNEEVLTLKSFTVPVEDLFIPLERD